MEETISPEENMVQTLTNMADKRLFKLVKWCKSLPLFKNILVSRNYWIEVYISYNSEKLYFDDFYWRTNPCSMYVEF